MLSPFVQRETLRLQRQWTPAQRDARKRAASRQRARLESLLCSSVFSSSACGAGKQSSAGLQRVAS